MCRHCSVDPSFRGFDLRRANARLGWFSPLGVAASIRASARWVGLRAHRFRFSACTVSELPFGGLAFGLTASAFRHAPLRSGCWASSFFRLPFRSCRSAGWPSGSPLPLFGMRRFGDCPRRIGSSVRRVGLRVHRFRFSARTASELPFGRLAFGLLLRKLPSASWPSSSRLPLFGARRFGVAAGRVGSSAFRFGDCPRRVGSSAGRVGLRVHRFRFSARTASGVPSADWSSGSPLPLFGTHRFGVAAGRVRSSAFRFGDSARRVGLRVHCFRFSARAASEIALGGLAFGLTASAFRHAPIRSGRSAGWFFRLPLRRLPSAGWPSGSLLPLFGLRRFGVAAGRVRSSTFRFGDCCSSGWPSGSPLPLFGMRRFGVTLGGLVLPLGGLAFGLTASVFRHAPFRSCRSASWPSGSPLPLFGMHRFGVAAGRVGSSAFRFGNCPRRVGLRVHCFRFSACAASELPLGGLVFGLTASAFRPAPLRSGRWASSFFRLPFRSCRSAGWFFRSVVGLRVHCFRFSARTALEIALGGLAFGLTASAFRHAPIRTTAPPTRGPTEHTDTTLVSLQTLIPTC